MHNALHLGIMFLKWMLLYVKIKSIETKPNILDMLFYIIIVVIWELFLSTCSPTQPVY
jgi:hypothetical protein